MTPELGAIDYLVVPQGKTYLRRRHHHHHIPHHCGSVTTPTKPLQKEEPKPNNRTCKRKTKTKQKTMKTLWRLDD